MINRNEILRKSGFQKLGHISRLDLDIWWSPDRKIELHVLDLGLCTLLRGTKTYYVKALSEEGEIYARDLEPMLEWLEVHFPVVRVYFNYFRDISRSQALIRIQEKKFRETGDDFVLDSAVENFSRVRADFESKRNQLHQQQGFRQLNALSFVKTSGLDSLLHEEEGRLRRDATLLAEEGKRLERNLGIANALMEEYQKKASAVSVVFSIATEAHWVRDETEFSDSLYAIMKELGDLDRYQIRQKLCHGQLKIPVEESSDPGLDWLALWGGGYPNPRSLEKWGQSFEELKRRIEARFMVLPVRDVIVAGSTKDQKKLIAPRILRHFLSKLPRATKTEPVPQNLPQKGRLIWIGNVMAGGTMTGNPFMMPIDELTHCYISGRSGSGKSYLLRVMVEGAILHSINVLFLDASNQGAGLMFPEDRKETLEKYGVFSLDTSYARGFAAKYYAPGLRLGEQLPGDLAKLAQGISIVSFKNMEEDQRCDLFGNILERLFETHSEESDKLKTLIFVDEAQRYTKKRMLHTEKAKRAAERAENLLDLHTRESRKFGVNVVIVSQTIRDFSHSAATIRQNTNTKIFLGNSDREVDYASDYLADGSSIVGLPPGEAIISNPLWGEVRVQVRPPFSKVREVPVDELKMAFSPQGQDSGPIELTPEEQDLLRVIKSYYREKSSYINFTTAAGQLGITSKRRMRTLVDNLIRKGYVREETIDGRGKPKLIIPMDQTPDQTRTEGGPIVD